MADKNSVRPLFVALAEHCVNDSHGVVTMLNPSIALTAPSGLKGRQWLARRFHIHTFVTCHQPGNVNLSQNTGINESIVIMRRWPDDSQAKPSTRIIALDKLPHDDPEVDAFHRCLLSTTENGMIPEGWGEVSHWPAARINAGDWSAAIWRSPVLAKEASRFAAHPKLVALTDLPGLVVHDTGRVIQADYQRVKIDEADPEKGDFPIIKSKGADGQQTIQSTPDEYCRPKKTHTRAPSPADKILEKAGHLLITAGQDTGTARLTAVADDKAYVGNAWMPVTGLKSRPAKAAAVFINSTAGRLQLMRIPGKKLNFPKYSATAAARIRLPDLGDDRIVGILADCWEKTKDTQVPQFRDGECTVRALWDEAVARAMDWDEGHLTHLRQQLHKEPHVSGLGYGQYT